MKNILIVEDDTQTLKALATYFKRNHYAVATASNAAEAVRSLEYFTPDLLISDWQLEDAIDGIELARMLSASIGELEIIFITGHHREQITSRAGDLNVTHVIRKPFEFSTLRAAVENPSVHDRP